MYCENCGAQINPEDRFCTNCGAPVAKTAEPVIPVLAEDVPVSLPAAEAPELFAAAAEAVSPESAEPVYAADPVPETAPAIPEPAAIPYPVIEPEPAPIVPEKPVYGAGDPKFESVAARSKKTGTGAGTIILAIIGAIIIVGIAAVLLFNRLSGSSSGDHIVYDDGDENTYSFDLPDDVFEGLLDNADASDDLDTWSWSDDELETANELALDGYDRLIEDLAAKLDDSSARSKLMEYSRADLWDLDDDLLDEFAAVYSDDDSTVRFVISHYAPDDDTHLCTVDDFLATYDDPDYIWAAVCTAFFDGKEYILTAFEDYSVDDWMSSYFGFYYFNGSEYVLEHTASADMRLDTESFDYDSYYFDDIETDYEKWDEILDTIEYIVVEYGTAEDPAGVSFCDFID